MRSSSSATSRPNSSAAIACLSLMDTGCSFLGAGEGHCGDVERVGDRVDVIEAQGDVAGQAPAGPALAAAAPLAELCLRDAALSHDHAYLPDNRRVQTLSHSG